MSDEFEDKEEDMNPSSDSLDMEDETEEEDGVEMGEDDEEETF